MEAMAIVLESPESLKLRKLPLDAPKDGDVVVDIAWSGISTGTERLLFTGEMPMFPGMGYPLVPGYESVGQISDARGSTSCQEGDWVFVPGARCFGDVRGLFGGASNRLVVPESRILSIDGTLGANGVLLALAATAHHAIATGKAGLPELVVGHGVLGRLIARLTLALGGAPKVWEKAADRRQGADGYIVVSPEEDERRDYATIVDVSGDSHLLDTLIQRLSPQGEIALAGFYKEPLHFAFPPAFMREARIRIAAEWQPEDMEAVTGMITDGLLSLEGLITHSADAIEADAAYRTAFEDPDCLKMILDWRNAS